MTMTVAGAKSGRDSSVTERFISIEKTLETLRRDREEDRQRQDRFEGEVRKGFSGISSAIETLAQSWTERRETDRTYFLEQLEARDAIAKADSRNHALTWGKIIGGAAAICGPMVVIGGIGWWSLNVAILTATQPLNARVAAIEAAVPTGSARRDQQIGELEKRLAGTDGQLQTEIGSLSDATAARFDRQLGVINEARAKLAAQEQQLIEIETQFRSVDQIVNFRLDHLWAALCIVWPADKGACPRPAVVEQRIGRDGQAG